MLGLASTTPASCGSTPPATPAPIAASSPVPVPTPVAPSSSAPASATPAEAVLLAAGDIASCSSSGDEATARLLDELPGTVATLGDAAYPNGSAANFRACYGPGWGRHSARTRPAPGNHEYESARAAPYFAYFGTLAGDPSKGYYSYELGAWHVVVVNSNCAEVGGCGTGSAQERWVRADLAASGARCTLAYWHHPLFTSGANHPPAVEMRPIFTALYEAGAEVVLAGHNHQYERFARRAVHRRRLRQLPLNLAVSPARRRRGRRRPGRPGAGAAGGACRSRQPASRAARSTTPVPRRSGARAHRRSTRS